MTLGLRYPNLDIYVIRLILIFINITNYVYIYMVIHFVLMIKVDFDARLFFKAEIPPVR